MRYYFFVCIFVFFFLFFFKKKIFLHEAHFLLLLGGVRLAGQSSSSSTTGSVSQHVMSISEDKRHTHTHVWWDPWHHWFLVKKSMTCTAVSVITNKYDPTDISVCRYYQQLMSQIYRHQHLRSLMCVDIELFFKAGKILELVLWNGVITQFVQQRVVHYLITN